MKECRTAGDRGVQQCSSADCRTAGLDCKTAVVQKGDEGVQNCRSADCRNECRTAGLDYETAGMQEYPGIGLQDSRSAEKRLQIAELPDFRLQKGVQNCRIGLQDSRNARHVLGPSVNDLCAVL